MISWVSIGSKNFLAFIGFIDFLVIPFRVDNRTLDVLCRGFLSSVSWYIYMTKYLFFCSRSFDPAWKIMASMGDHRATGKVG